MCIYIFFLFFFPQGDASNNLLTRQSGDTRQLLALEQLQAGSATGGDVAELVLNLVAVSYTHL